MPDQKQPYVDPPLADYLDEAASGAPTPGGGSVGALSAALGTTMASMAANFTVGKKKYKDVEPEVKELLGVEGALVILLVSQIPAIIHVTKLSLATATKEWTE